MSISSSGNGSSVPGFGSGGSLGAPLGASGEKVEAFLGKGSKVVGTLTFSGPVELDGYVEGEIISQDRLTIGESAVINARITGAEVLVKGTVNGDISASKKLSLRRPARIIGNISTTSLSIEEGVIFEGKSSMNSGGGASAGVSSRAPTDRASETKGSIDPKSREAAGGKVGASV
jgi:cytoskeletal protein CcmA (bactofilin family)